MRVMITGGTGFVGYHTAQLLLNAGHTVSLLVRSVSKMNTLYGRDSGISYTVGDITDAEKVVHALKGADAVIHAAAMVSTDANDAEEVFNTNVEGAKTVIGSALDLGIGPIIHVSSVTALYDPKAKILDENSPPGAAKNAYGRSKVACDEYVRDLQEEGHPIYITYPATVIGPDDPGLTEAHVGMQGYLMAFVPLMPTHIPISEEAMEYATKWVKLDNSKVEDVLDFEFRSVEETMADTVSWLCEAGHITDKQAGILANRTA